MLQKLADLFHRQVLGMNRRNLGVIYRNASRQDFTVADDKVETKALLEPAGIPVPQTHAVLGEIRSIKDAWPQVAQRQNVVVKPAKGRAGNNILVLNRTDQGWETPSGTIYGRAAIQRHIADIIYGAQSYGAWDRALVEDRVVAHSFFREIYDGGLPDIRIIVHQETPLLAMIRLPTDASDGKANLHQGALGIRVDLETGQLGRGYDYRQYQSTHPDSGVWFTEQTLPHWEQALDVSQAVSELVPIEYLGIDIVLDETRGPLVMEINARPGLEIQNVNQQGLHELIPSA